MVLSSIEKQDELKTLYLGLRAYVEMSLAFLSVFTTILPQKEVIGRLGFVVFFVR